jgi:pilus assembly protein Flp/PilA
MSCFQGGWVGAVMSMMGQVMAVLVLRFLQFLKNESGSTAIEYGVIAAGISIAIMTVMQSLGSRLISTFMKFQNALD